MKNKDIPRWTARFLRWFCRPSLFEELQGDLQESFEKNKSKMGRQKARRYYSFEVVRLFRPSVIHPVSFFGVRQWSSSLFANYLRVSYRNILRHKTFSLINIIGLAVSMSICLLAIGFIAEMYSFDRFHEDKKRILRIVSDLKEMGEERFPYASAPLLAGTRLRNEYPGYDDMVLLYKSFRGELTAGDKTLPVKGLYASEKFFSFFTYKLLHGSPASVLTAPDALVLTEDFAKALFGKTDVIGSIVNWRGRKNYTVTGVAENPPHNTHIRFDAIASLSSHENEGNHLYSWENMWNSYVYVKLHPDHSEGGLLTALGTIAAEENQKLPYFDVAFKVQPLLEIFPGEQRYNQVGVRMDQRVVNWIATLALIIIISACINYSNLSIARSIQRSREVSIRKVIGGNRKQLFIQFTVESILIAICSLVFALVLFVLVRSQFINLNEDFQRTTTLHLTPQILLYFILFSLFVGFVAGLLPSLAHSRVRPIVGLRGVSTLGLAGKIGGVRKFLITLQIALSLIFTTLVYLTYRQYEFAINFDLGFQTENILNIQLQGNDPDILIASLGQLPEVTTISQSNQITSAGVMMSDFAKYRPNQDSAIVYNLLIDENFISNLGHQLLAGENFTGQSIDRSSMIVNETFVKRFGFTSPEEILGETFEFYGDPHRVTGVVADFHNGTIRDEIMPFAFASSGNFRFLNVKIRTENMSATLSKIDDIWHSVDPVHPLEAEFYDERIERAYSDLSSTMKTIGLLSVAAVSIAILGLLGMIVYSIESKTREMAIRKVLGASLMQLFSNLSKGFVILFLIGVITALPASYWLFERLIVQGMVYRAEIGWLEMSYGVFLLLVLILISSGSRVLRASNVNPVDYLRNE